jgi:hypothetical protein
VSLEGRGRKKEEGKRKRLDMIGEERADRYSVLTFGRIISKEGKREKEKKGKREWKLVKMSFVGCLIDCSRQIETLSLCTIS